MAEHSSVESSGPAPVSDDDLSGLAPPDPATRVPGWSPGPEPSDLTDTSPEALASYPPPTQPARSGRRAIPALAIILALAVLAVGGTWLGGGFNSDPGRLARLAPGTEVDMGPMSIALERATARKLTSSWSVYAHGRCHNNTDEPISIDGRGLTSNGFSARHPVSATVVGDALLYFGPGQTLGTSSTLNPGMPWVPCTLVFDFDEFPDTDLITVGVSKLQWIDASPTGLQNMRWSATRYGWRFELPLVTQRPDRP